jgi:hypothetical protein
MTTIFERVETALGTINPAVPFAMAPYKSSGDLPDQYMAYQMIAGEPEQHADDSETERSYIIQVSVFSHSGLASLPGVDAAMLAAGFEKSSSRSLPQDAGTGHYGLALDYVYLETKE